MDKQEPASARYEGHERYMHARRRGLREDLVARLMGKPNDLLPYEALAQLLQAYAHNQVVELRSIPLDQIVGSAGRPRDFTRSFLPRAGIRSDRWARIDAAMSGLVGVPPIEVYQIGGVYFVADGNHRVSVARAAGFVEIEAYVTILPVDPGLDSDDTLDEAIVKAECANFLAQTRLADQCGDLDIHFTRPGGYPRLLEHIYAHGAFMAARAPSQGRPAYPEAARDWYASVYLPIVAAIREQRLMRRFPTSTAADLYVWVVARLSDLHAEYSGDVDLAEVTGLLESSGHSPLVAAVLGIVNRLARRQPTLESLGEPAA